MGVAQYIQNDCTIQDPATYMAALDGNTQVLRQIAGAFAPHQNNPAAMNIQVDPGSLINAATGAVVNQSMQTSSTIAAPTVYPRIDLAVVNAVTGALSIVPGAEASSPSAPACPAGSFPVAQIALAVGQTSIVNANLTDVRTVICINTNPLSAIDSGLPGVTVANNVTHPTYQLDCTAAGASFTIDKSLTPGGGTNRLDTGTIQNSTWYYIWAINNGTTTAGLLSASNTSPTMTGVPDYTYTKRIGAIYVDNSGNFIMTSRVGNLTTRTVLAVVSGQSGGPTQFDMSAAVPPTAKAWVGYGRTDSSTGALSVGPTAALVQMYTMQNGAAAMYGPIPPVPIVTAQKGYFQQANAGNVYVNVTGWMD